MDDLISRQAAIDEFKKELTVGESKGNYVTLCSAVSYEGAKQILESLPSAQPQPEQRWIPCSEKMPRGEVEVIVSCHDNSGDTPFNYSSCGFTTTDGEYWIVDNEINYHVIAWMPLPEPYR